MVVKPKKERAGRCGQHQFSQKRTGEGGGLKAQQPGGHQSRPPKPRVKVPNKRFGSSSLSLGPATQGLSGFRRLSWPHIGRELRWAKQEKDPARVISTERLRRVLEGKPERPLQTLRICRGLAGFAGAFQGSGQGSCAAAEAPGQELAPRRSHTGLTDAHYGSTRKDF